MICVITSRPCLLVVAVLLMVLLAPPALAAAVANLLLHTAVCSTYAGPPVLEKWQDMRASADWSDGGNT